MDRKAVATYSLVACDLEAGQWGVAVQSKFLAVGSVVPWAEPYVGAIATQSYANPRYGPEGLALLREGRSAEEAVEALTAADEGRAERQVGIVDGQGRAATFTGDECHDWAGGRTGDGYAAQGNILVSGETVDALAVTFEQNGHLSLAERLLECLAAAQAAGGDRRGQQSASLLVVERDAGYASLSDVVVDLRVDDHQQPIVELRRHLHEIADLELVRFRSRVSGLTPVQEEAVRQMATSLVNKLLHAPTLALKRLAAQSGSGTRVTLIRELFGMDHPAETPAETGTSEAETPDPTGRASPRRDTR